VELININSSLNRVIINVHVLHVSDSVGKATYWGLDGWNSCKNIGISLFTTMSMILGLFNDGFPAARVIASNGRILWEWWTGKPEEGTCDHWNVSQVRRSPDLDTNPGPPKYKAGESATRQWRSVPPCRQPKLRSMAIRSFKSIWCWRSDHVEFYTYAPHTPSCRDAQAHCFWILLPMKLLCRLWNDGKIIAFHYRRLNGTHECLSGQNNVVPGR
jgi:hypothetical protein